MLKYEIKKYINNKAVILMLLGFLAMKVLVSYFSLNIDVDFGIDIYREYLERWEGGLTDTKAAEIEAEHEYLNTIKQKYDSMMESFINGDITFDEFDDCTKEYNLSEAKIRAFTPVYAKYRYFLKTDEKVEFYYDLEIMEFVNLLKQDFALILLVCFVVAFVYDLESRSDISMVIRSLPEGRHRFERTKMGVALGFALICTVLFCGIDLVLYAYKYSFENWGGSIHSIMQFARFPVNTDIYGTVAIMMGAKVIHSMLLVVVSAGIARATKRVFLTIFITSVIFMLPLVIG